MLERIKQLLGNFNYKLYFALIVLGLCPTVYTTVRVFFIGNLPGEWAYSIAGQMSWVNLLYEVLNEAILLPLFHFMGSVKNNKKELTNRIRTGMLFSLVIYSVLSGVVSFFAEDLLRMMATDASIIEASATYIRIESIANIFLILVQFALITLVTVNERKYIYGFAVIRLIMCVVSDVFLVSEFPVSLKLGINGIGFGNILVNGILLIASLALLRKERIFILSKEKLNYSWMKGFWKTGGISGLESLVRNAAYMLMIARMVNVVGEQGTYWVANSFVWNWLLLPVIQLGELIKQEVAADENNIRTNSPGYFAVTMIISALWFVSIPLWKPFMRHILGFANIDKLFNLVLILTIFYVFYAIQNVFDATFYGMGKTNYMLLESVITNSVYYGIAFGLYMMNIWKPTLVGIALLFGFGNVFDSLVSLIVYVYMRGKIRNTLSIDKT